MAQGQPIDLYAEEQVNPSKPNRLITPFGLIITLAALLMLSVVGWGIYQNSLNQPEGGPAAPFTLPIIGNMDETISLSDYRGQVVVINFWGSWCAPCRDEAPMLQRLYTEYQEQGVVFIGIAVKDIERDSLAYIAEFGITYPNVMDLGAKIEKAYYTRGVPETFIVDANGEITKFFLAVPRESDLRNAIEETLGP